MHGWVYEQMDDRVHACVSEQTHECINERQSYALASI